MDQKFKIRIKDDWADDIRAKGGVGDSECIDLMDFLNWLDEKGYLIVEEIILAKACEALAEDAHERMKHYIKEKYG